MSYAPDKLDEFVNIINTQLQPMFMQIRKGMSEEDGQQYYALVSGGLLLCVCFFSVNPCIVASDDFPAYILYITLLTCMPNDFSLQVNLADTEITRSDYSDNELELFRKAVSTVLLRHRSFNLQYCFSLISVICKGGGLDLRALLSVF